MQKITIIFTLLLSGFITSCSLFNSSNSITVPVVPSPTVTGATLPLPLPLVALTPFLARGTEPFWALEQTSTGAKFSQPNSTGVVESWYTSIQTNSGGTITILGTPVSTGSSIGAVLTPGTCSDGMSDTAYSYTAIVTLSTGILSGCAN
ncbi:hypothetical protein H7169_01525 [Candidatus Gracilibacteria bacterium]|nr:hypothetical protein [Candidatus Gracilibacteria bacterium]